VEISFFMIVHMAALEEEDTGAVSLSTPDATLELEAVASPAVRRIGSASPAITEKRWVWCCK
jgi:hypothetical protein